MNKNEVTNLLKNMNYLHNRNYPIGEEFYNIIVDLEIEKQEFINLYNEAKKDLDLDKMKKITYFIDRINTKINKTLDSNDWEEHKKTVPKHNIFWVGI